MFSDHNHDVAHSSSWDDDPNQEVHGFDLMISHLTDESDKEQAALTKILEDALQKFKTALYKFANEHDIDHGEAEEAAKDWFNDLWNETFY